MNAVTVNKADLIKIIEENRSKHRAIFDEAVEGYRAQVVQILEEHIEKVKNGSLVQVSVSLPKPVDQTKEYDRVIAMLKMHIELEVTVDEVDFASYVQDDWAWKRQFLMSNSVYSATAAADFAQM